MLLPSAHHPEVWKLEKIAGVNPAQEGAEPVPDTPAACETALRTD